jgi:hypothetical protein
MHRDMDLVRKILMAVADNPSGWAPSGLEIEGYTDEQIGYHALIMIEAGLVAGEDVTVMRSGPTGMITRLTWQGHDFLEAAREPTRWQEAKTIIGKVGSASLQVWTTVLTQLTLKSLGL